MAATGDATHGRFSSIEVSEDNVTYFKVGGLMDQNEDNTVGESPCFDKDSEGVEEYLSGFTSTTFGFTVNTKLRNEGQRILRSSYRNKTKFFARYYENFSPGSGDVFTLHTGCKVLSANKSNPLQGTSTTDYTVRGKPTDLTQDT